MTVRFYSSVSVETTLSLTVNSAATSIQVASVTGFPALTPYTLSLDYEGATEELVDVTAAAGTTLTVTRAIDGTSAVGHSAGARVRHVSSGRDFSDSRAHENSNAQHGATGAVVGTTNTQTLTNKTLTAPVVTSPSVSGTATFTGEIALSNLLRGSRALATDSMYESRVTADANARWFSRADGRMLWGTGAAVADTNLYRSGINTLTTDGAFTVGGGVSAASVAAGSVTTTGAVVVGGDLTVDGLNGMVHARKTSDTSVASDIVPDPDPHLTVPVVANAVYEIDGLLLATSASVTPDIAFQMDGPALSVGTWQTIGPPTSATTDDTTVRTISTAMGSSRTYGLQTASQVFGFPVKGMLETGANAGNFRVSWAQSTSNATPTTLKIYSWIRLTRVA